MTLIKTRYRAYQMAGIAEFCTLEAVENRNTGMTTVKPVTVMTQHYAPIRRTLNQTYSLVGTELDNTRIIAVQHTGKLVDLLESNPHKVQVRIKGAMYNIVTNSIDDTNVYIKYDLLTIRKVERNGTQ